MSLSSTWSNGSMKISWKTNKIRAPPESSLCDRSLVTSYNRAELVRELCNYAQHDVRRVAVAEGSTERLELGVVLLLL